MSRNTDPRPTSYAEWEDLEADRDRLRSELDDADHAIRFLAKQEARTSKIRHEAIQMLATGRVEEAKELIMMRWPIVQGLRNQMDIEEVGNQPCDLKRVRPAIDRLLRAELARMGAP